MEYHHRCRVSMAQTHGCMPTLSKIADHNVNSEVPNPRGSEHGSPHDLISPSWRPSVFIDISIANISPANTSSANGRFANISLANISLAIIGLATTGFASISLATTRLADISLPTISLASICPNIVSLGFTTISLGSISPATSLLLGRLPRVEMVQKQPPADQLCMPWRQPRGLPPFVLTHRNVCPNSLSDGTASFALPVKGLRSMQQVLLHLRDGWDRLLPAPFLCRTIPCRSRTPSLHPPAPLPSRTSPPALPPYSTVRVEPHRWSNRSTVRLLRAT
ncbi:hypothetical protein BAUCODRAFT_332598 [Baudoinia panamericana UAMH 10762]|uniref:Uncharacterized protein n=1 Tax=Baudoinia panamericana (strain UAMH 10762) TaxID=717646 RepID=M2MXJ0_BAUPA|nr:uncharacterized protein BAUCODRAFT_332598 [Baudoinia panamericana UAMH 10762]EMC90970.1 hypothetical protein BAUCODRAFT_332598 [Baudoinia panamericana UAMH 10762]